jgi:hypothetical protein
MKLRDIIPYCVGYIDYPNKMKNYWFINGIDYYQIDRIEGCVDAQYTVTLSQYNNSKNILTLNLEHEIIIYDLFIVVHKTDTALYDDNQLFRIQENYIDNNTKCLTEYYVLGLAHTSGEIQKNMRYLFKDLINPPVQPKPAELSLDDKLDNLIEDLMKDSRVMAVKKLKRMLNERL